MKKLFSFEFLRFIIIGGINTFSTSAIATLLNSLLGYSTSFALGYASGLVISFFLNTYFTFREKPSWSKFMVYPLTYVPNFIIQYISVLVLVEKFSFQSSVAYVSAAIIGVPVTFLMMRTIVFKK